MSIRWFDPGRLVDRELELIRPDVRWINDVMVAVQHPLTVRDAPREAGTTRRQLFDFLKAAPGGNDPGDPAQQRVQGYAFWMRLRPEYNPPVRIAGGCSLRVVSTSDVVMFYGHIGYHVYPPARGARRAERACRLLMPLARKHGLTELIITCNPDNWASRRTCERLGCELLEIVDLPPSNKLYQRGDRQKCRYRLSLRSDSSI